MPARLPEHLRRTPAERARDRRAQLKRQREAGKAAMDAPRRSSGKSGKSGPKPSKFARGHFVAVDGEGFSEGPELSWQLGSGEARTTYTGREHFYAYLAASDGSEIYAETGRLSTKQCLDFLLAIAARDRHAIVVAFGASYDVTQMLRDLTLEQVQHLLSGQRTGERVTLDVALGEHDYRLELRPRKSLSVTRWEGGAAKYERTKAGNWKRAKGALSVTLWDVWGFFQDSFVGVLKKWLPHDPALAMIEENKAKRSVFDRRDLEEIRRYNGEELRCLVDVMRALRDAVGAMGLTLARWDGAGAIAASILKLHDVKQHRADTPGDVFDAARHAYSGGHIEVAQIGFHNGTVYHYDVNSAYPAEFAQLPSLAQGRWIRGTGEPPEGFTVVHSRWKFKEPSPFYPLFFREENGTIVYPREGEGWHWFSEWSAARDFAESFGAHRFEVVEWWHFKPSRNAVKPFGWIRDYYQRRQQLTAEAKRSGIPNGEEKIIKLGLNSLYGKTAQQIGARKDDDGETQPPPYFQLEWAGAVTAGCRAKLMRAAMQNPTAIIAFATDGLFSTAPLDLDCPSEKVLGAWEAQTHAGITMVMPGVYWLHERDSEPLHYSRGFDKASMSDPDFVHLAWYRKQASCEILTTRLVGLGTAQVGGAQWDMRGFFVTAPRKLSLNGDNSKRYCLTYAKRKPHLELVPTLPRDHDGLNDMSAPFDVAWLTPRDGFEEEREEIDADLA